MRAHVGRRGGGPDSDGRGHGREGPSDQGGHVIGFRRSGHKPQRHGVLARVAAFDLQVVGGRVRWSMVITHIDGMRVRGRLVIVVVIRVIVVAVRVHVLQCRRSGDRQHGHGNEGCDSAKHRRECMGKVWRRQTARLFRGPGVAWPEPQGQRRILPHAWLEAVT